MEQAAQLEAIKRYTIQKLGSDSTGHGLDHIQGVKWEILENTCNNT